MRFVNKVLAVAAAALSVAVLVAPQALANEIVKIDWAAHPGAGIAGAAGVAALVFIALLGLGCALSVLGVMLPSLRAAMDRQARGSSPAWSTVVGLLVGVGVAAATGGAHATGSHVVGSIVILLLVVPAALLCLAGSLATVSLLGERMIGLKGLEASPLRLACTGSVVLGLAILAGVILRPLGVLMATVVLAWPLGVAIGALATRIRGQRAAPPAGPPPAGV